MKKGAMCASPRVTIEEVVDAQPDVILLPSEPFQFTEEHIQIFAGLDIPAAKNNRIVLVDGSPAYVAWYPHCIRIKYLT
jgi:ABC-type Fe3+-hydroxamate transport system substrate-binding protein